MTKHPTDLLEEELKNKVADDWFSGFDATRISARFDGCVKPGWRYEVHLEHAGSNPAYTGTPKPDYDYTLAFAEKPANVLLDDPQELFGVHSWDFGAFTAPSKTATVTVYKVDVKICTPNDESWGTCPQGVVVSLDGAAFVNVGGKSEIRVTQTFAQLRELGLLPAQDEDGVDEMAAYDVGTLGGNDGSDLTDCLAFEQMARARRGRASNERTLTLDSNPPNSELSESFFRAAGAEVLFASYGGIQSAKRQIMNQADCFYYSGHGHHRTGMVDDFSPNVVSNHWKRDLDCVIIAGCSVLDINDYNNNFLDPRGEWDPENHAASPGTLWESKGPNVLLGYNFRAPLDSSRAPAKIVRSWQNLRQTMGDVEAWMKANDNKNGRNACAIVKGVKYVYFKRTRHKFYSTYEKVEVGKESWND